MLKSIKNCSGKCSFLFSLILSLLFISCFNSLTPNPDSSTEPAQGSNTALNISSDRYVDISGHYSLDGALPKEIAASMYPQEQSAFSKSSGISYSALPLVGTTHNVVEYYAIATDANGVESPVSGTVTVADRSFQIFHLKIGVSWIVEVGIKVKNTVNGTDVWVRCLYDISEPQTFTETSFTMNKTFLLKPDTSGTGSINLEMTVDSSITDFTVSLDDAEKKASWEAAFNNDTNATKVITSPQAKIKFAGLPAGVYEVTLKFYKTSVSTGYPVFSTVQTINVISGMTTENWASDGTSLFTGSGTATVFNLTSTLINEYEKSLIYVGQTSVAASFNVTAADTNEGTAYAPLATLQEAINRIESNNNPMDYRIFVSGTVSGAPTGDAEINSSINGKALSITIDKTGNTNDAAPVINGSGSGNNSVLYIETEVPVKIRNVTITHGSGSSGGGLSIIDSDTKVTLEGNVIITENHASVSGGGIYNEGELIIKNATIRENTSSGHGAGIYNAGDLVIYNGEISSNSVNGSAAYKYGGGIYNSSSCKIKGGTITLNNSTSHGGGIFNTNTGHLELSGGTISANALPNADDADDYGGAGIYSSGTFDFSGGTITGHTYIVNGSSVKYTGCVEIRGGTFTMTGGLISGNRSRGYTAGVYISSIPSTISISGGTISDNVSFAVSNKGGAIYCDGDIKLSGSVYIPEGDNNGTTGKGYNDIYLSAGKKIIAAGNLSKHLETGASPLAITVTNWTRGAAAIEADGTGITDLSSYLNFVSSKTIDWYTELSGDKTKIILNSPIYVAGSTVHPTCGVAGSASGDGSSSAPFDSIANACSIMDKSYLDYLIYIDGTIPAGQVIGSGFTGAAHSITITGANDLADDGTPEDKIEGSTTGIGFTLNTTSAPVTLKKLLITGCELPTSTAAGVYITSGTLSLGDDLVITGNKAGGTGGKGAGVSINNGASTVLNMSGNVKIYGNTDCSTPANPCNVYLGGSTPSDTKKINVTGPLAKGSDKANIYVSTQTPPTLTSSVTFTNGYGYGSGGHNAGVVPATYFHGDSWAVRASAAGEAELAASGGSITVEDIYSNLEIDVDKQWYNRSQATTDAERTVTVTSKAPVNGTVTPLTASDITYTYKLYLNGEEVPASYYPSNVNTITFGQNLPRGNYQLNINGLYNGRNYSAGFDFQVADIELENGFTATPPKTVSGPVGTGNNISSVFIEGRTLQIPTLIAGTHEVTQGEYRQYMAFYGEELNNSLKPESAQGVGDDYPAYYINWYEAIMYCNLRSKAEGLTPVYSLTVSGNPETDVDLWKTVSGTRIGKTSDGKFYYNNNSNTSAEFNAISYNENANGWRLPTEAEWEYLARAGNTEDYIYSGSNDSNQVVHASMPSLPTTDTSKSPNGLGLYHMSGNLWEFCWDYNNGDISTDTPATGVVTPNTSYSRVMRGGGNTQGATVCKIATRSSTQPHNHSRNIGFRVVRTVK